MAFAIGAFSARDGSTIQSVAWFAVLTAMEKNVPFIIDKTRTSILYQQSQAIQALAAQFHTEYASQRSVKVRVEWGKILNQININDLNCVNAKGETVTGDEAKGTTFGISRSSGYNYIRDYISATNYPQVIQDAAANAGLNLALPHVQAKYGEMVTKGLPSNPSAPEIKGIISELQDAQPNKTSNPRESAKARFQRLLKEAFEYAREEKLTAEVVTATLESEIAAAFGMPGARVARELSPIYKPSETSAKTQQ